MISQIKIKEGLFYKINTFVISNINSYYLHKNNGCIILNLNYFEETSNQSLNESSLICNLEFKFEKKYLDLYSDNNKLIFELFPEFLIHEPCCNTQMIVHEIINCKLDGIFRNIFLESKALSLLLDFYKSCSANQTDCDNCKFLTKPLEKEKIFKAKDIILNNLNNPPTISKLSLMIGINQCYLKKGFKELFGTTVYDFIQEQRMLKAKFLLTTTELTISQIADVIGFSTNSNFSSAFKKHTGVYPREFQQN